MGAGVVDALVMASASLRGGLVYTSDPDDFDRLAEVFGNVRVEAIGDDERASTSFSISRCCAAGPSVGNPNIRSSRERACNSHNWARIAPNKGDMTRGEVIRLLVLAGWLPAAPSGHERAAGLRLPRPLRTVLRLAKEQAVPTVDIYGGLDPWNVRAYTLPVAARHVRVPAATLRSWVCGRSYPVGEDTRRFLPLIKVPTGRPRFLTFTNLVEAHVLASMRRKHELPMSKVRKAIKFVEEELEVAHPLATEAFKTDGVDLFVERYGRLINASKDGQGQIKHAIEAGLTRINYEMGIALQLFPLTRSEGFDQPKLIVIDPRLAFGRPVLAGSGVPVDEVAERFQAGESAADLAGDFRVEKQMVEEAIRASRAAA